LLQVDTHTILRHKSPFLFLEHAELDKNGFASAMVELPLEEFSWAAPLELSLLHVECAAQLISVVMRLRLKRERSRGVFAGLRSFEWLSTPQDVRRVTVQYKKSSANFHEFEGTFYNKEQEPCAHLIGTTHLSDDLIPDSSNEQDNSFSDASPIFQLQEKGNEEGESISAQASRECEVYRGHFPGEPITPGVLIAEMMLAAIQKQSELPLCLKRVEALSFNAPIKPGDVVTVNTKSLEDYRFRVSVVSGRKRIAKAGFELQPVA
jgi:3-hydroxymyristoyl/3-hydroxydecanoyl-(acyl carrier protein) dehydratase